MGPTGTIAPVLDDIIHIQHIKTELVKILCNLLSNLLLPFVSLGTTNFGGEGVGGGWGGELLDEILAISQNRSVLLEKK